ncbi:MAG: BTAD domain-containing putative transcriptional regulator, partial [Aquabacterium sp.]
MTEPNQGPNPGPSPDRGASVVAARLTLFGVPRLWLHDRAVAVGSRKAMALLLLMALDGGCSRDYLVRMLWPELDAAAARRNLRRDLFRLRKAGVPVLEGDAEQLVLGPQFAVQSMAEPAGPQRFEPALRGLDGVAGVEFDAWLARTRAALEQRRSQDWRREAAALVAQGQADAALALLDALLGLDACDEAAALQAMALLQARGRADAALAVYGRMERALAELELPPSAAARAQRDALRP